MPREVEVKSVLNKTKRRDPWFLDEYTFNPYSSCGFNCLFCYIRGSKYGNNLETSLSVKINAIDLLEKQLSNRAKKGQYGIIGISSATEPYLKLEEKYRLTRQALEIILHYRFPIHVITRSHLVERDFDLLKRIDQEAILPSDLEGHNRGVILSFSFSTLEDHVASIFEPGATPPSKRLETLQKAVDEDFLTGISLMPLIPYISDTSEQLEKTFQQFKEIGVHYILPATLTLYGGGPASSKTLMLKALQKHYPDLVEKYERFFSHGFQMPIYYQNAFKRKMEELARQYQIRDRIIG